MYTIIGGDLREYGPVSAEDVRQWIAEGRLNEHSQIKGEGDAEFRPLETFPEFASSFTPSSFTPGSSIPDSSIPKLPPSAFAVGLPPEEPVDYELDITGCISRGWALVKNNFGVLFVSVLVLGLVSFAFFSVLGLVVSVVMPKQMMAIAGVNVGFKLLVSAVGALVLGPLAGGLYLVFLNTIRGEAASVGDVFAGFQRAFMPLFLGYLVVALLTSLCMAPFNYAVALRLEPLLAQMQNATPSQVQDLMQQATTMFVLLLPILVVCMIPVTYLTVNWMFTLPLIADKGLDFWTAMRVSWEMVHKHWWHVFGLVVLVGLLNIAGLFACCIGVLFTFPVGVAALMYAYETIFSGKPAA